MNPVVITVSGTQSGLANMDYRQNPIAISVAIKSTGSYTFGYTLDNVYTTSFSASTANWITMITATGSATASITWPVSALQIVGVTGMSTATILQATLSP